jgi:hypothetical protein
LLKLGQDTSTTSAPAFDSSSTASSKRAGRRPGSPRLQFGDHTDPHAGDIAVQCLQQRGNRRVDAGRVQRVMAADEAVQQGGVAHVRVTGPAWSRLLASATRP